MRHVHSRGERRSPGLITEIRMRSAAVERRGNNSQECNRFYVKAKARNQDCNRFYLRSKASSWSRQSYLSYVRSTAGFSHPYPKAAESSLPVRRVQALEGGKAVAWALG